MITGEKKPAKIDYCPIIHKKYLNTKQQMEYIIYENLRINQNGKRETISRKVGRSISDF
jgi:hypothetical protein